MTTRAEYLWLAERSLQKASFHSTIGLSEIAADDVAIANAYLKAAEVANSNQRSDEHRV